MKSTLLSRPIFNLPSFEDRKCNENIYLLILLAHNIKHQHNSSSPPTHQSCPYSMNTPLPLWHYINYLKQTPLPPLKDISTVAKGNENAELYKVTVYSAFLYPWSTALDFSSLVLLRILEFLDFNSSWHAQCQSSMARRSQELHSQPVQQN